MAKTPQTQKDFIDYRFNETIKSIEDVKQNVKEVSDKLDTTFATKDYVDTKVKGLDERVVDLESDRQWVVRAIVGAVIVGIIYAAFKFKASTP